ncbi:hypothetical protein evm_005030 [Chilo suppressalis]|nr:hypothetical protein evm_005030 [Chilo suppressalis]
MKECHKENGQCVGPVMKWRNKLYGINTLTEDKNELPCKVQIEEWIGDQPNGETFNANARGGVVKTV